MRFSSTAIGAPLLLAWAVVAATPLFSTQAEFTRQSLLTLRHRQLQQTTRPRVTSRDGRRRPSELIVAGSGPLDHRRRKTEEVWRGSTFSTNRKSSEQFKQRAAASVGSPAWEENRNSGDDPGDIKPKGSERELMTSSKSTETSSTNPGKKSPRGFFGLPARMYRALVNSFRSFLRLWYSISVRGNNKASVNTTNKNQKQKSTGVARRLMPSLSFFLLCWMIILARMLHPMGPVPEEVPYSQFLELVNADGKAKTALEGVLTEARFSAKRIDFTVGDISYFTRPIMMASAGMLEAMLDKGVTFYAQKVNALAAAVGALLPVAIFTILWGVILSRMLGGGSDSTVGKRVPPPLVPTKGFDMVAGIDNAKVELIEIVDFLKNPQKYSKTGARLPKGVLMVGEPGTGKTLLARAMAGEAGVPFFYCSGSEFVEMFVGRGASRLRSLFKRARAAAPCVVFVDELDALGKKRDGGVFSGGAASEVEQTLNQLLVCMDGLDTSRNGVIVLGATNRPEVLDTALCRPGRFDRIVKVDRPDRDGREAILNVHTRNMQLAEDVDLGIIATATPGFTGAELEGVCNEAAIRSVRRGDEKNLVNQYDFESALRNFISSRGVLTKNPIKEIGSNLKNTFFGGTETATPR
mmetsp:Transcript_3965/g.9336  ORF Transcript_3965/g.9336 Transcript_3965/m.9336 type:complete len:637 (-) Transcript_3965:143-2053(-)